MTANETFNRRKQWIILVAMSAMMVLINFELSAVNIALPSIASALHLDITNLSLVVSTYLVTWAIFLIPAGKISDAFSKVNMFYIGSTIFAVASGVAGFSNHFLLLITCRILQGLGAAIALPVSTSIAYMAFSKEERGIPVGTMMLVAGLSLAAGPVFGGMITHYLGWRWIFFINIPIAFSAMLLAKMVVTEQPVERNPFTFDYLGFLFLTVVLAGLVYLLTSARDYAWFSGHTITFSLIIILAVIVLVIIERRHANPLLPVHLLRIKHFSAALTSRLIMNIAFLSILFSGPLYLQNILHYSANKAGLIFMSLTLMLAFFSYISGRLAKHLSTKILAIFGFLIAIVGYIALSFLNIHSSEPIIIFYLAMVGAGIGIVFVSLTTMAMREISESDAAVANGLFFTFAVFGNMLGVTIATNIILKRGMQVLKHILSEHQVALTQAQIQHVQQLFATVKTETTTHAISQYAATAFVSGFSMAMWFVVGLLVIGILITVVNKIS